MEYLVKNEEIEATAAYKKLDPCFQSLVLKRSNKKIISTALLIHRNSGVLQGSVGGNNLRVLKELIEKEKESPGWYDEEKEKRMNIIGQNGNEGTHYDN